MRPNLSRQTMAYVIASAVVIAAVTILAISWRRTDPPLDPTDFARLIELKNTAIADLENIPNQKKNDGEKCIESFREIARLVPGELLGPRNLVLAHLVALEKVDHLDFPDKFATAAATCRTAMQELKLSEPESGIPHVLAAKLAIQGGDQETAIREYQIAIDKLDDPFPWSEVFLILEYQLENPLRIEALRGAIQSHPDNLVLLRYFVSHQAGVKDPAIADTLTNIRRVLRPLTAELAKQGIHLNDEIDSFMTRLDESDETVWQELKGRMFQWFNVVVPHYEYDRDKQQLQRHPLEFVVRDYSNKFYQQAPGGDSVIVPPTNVRFVEAFSAGSFDHIDDALDIAVCDFNLDGANELVILRRESIEVYALNSETSEWNPIAKSAVPPGMRRMVLADFDRDTLSDRTGKCQVSDLDILVFGPGGHRIFENTPNGMDGGRELVELPAVLPLDSSVAIHAAAVADVEHDGDLDLILTTDHGPSIWVNLENWTFSETKHRPVTAPNTSPYTTIATVDWNRDVLTDLLFASKTTSGQLENMRHGRFRWQPFRAEMMPVGGVNSLAICDVDGNASWDILSSGDQGIMVTLTQTLPGRKVQPIDTIIVSKRPSLGVASWDYDNDGHLDVVAWGDGGVEIFRGKGDGSFVDATAAIVQSSSIVPPTQVARCHVGDLDQDGDQDLIILSDGGIRGYVNDGGNKNHWIDIRLSAEPDAKFRVQRTNLYGVGSLIELRVGSSYQARIANDQAAHFGIGNSKKADAIRVLWTNGIPQNVVTAPNNQMICEHQRLLKGSCPYLYTWTGERYEFLTDLLWAAPIGLQVAEGELMPSRAWEYLLIPGDRLKSKDGEYRVQVTEELWEAAYFDVVQLIAVDHPADVSVFSNEKVGPPQIAQYLIHAIPTKQLTPPVAAHDSFGRDVLSLIQHRDDHFVRLFDSRHKQGLTNEHFIELDLGQLDKPKSVKLVLTGWVFPTDTSINVAISQNPNLLPPQPPSVWMPDASDKGGLGWKRVISNMGFPGGKTKTIVVDLPVDQFTNDDYRVRIVTSMELYWDEIVVAVDAPASEYRQSPLELLGANLHYRGFSKRHDGQHHGPDRYDYDAVATDAVWSPMSGSFTRYGDVTMLVDEADDQLVVMAAGDEMTLRFKQLSPPPEGWRRDFILHNVGWDKDADVNTVTGFQVEPLPYRGMKQYPPGANSVPPNSEQYRDYLRIYQTRKQNMEFWNQLSNPYNRAD